jgi:hypothetical protein
MPRKDVQDAGLVAIKIQSEPLPIGFDLDEVGPHGDTVAHQWMYNSHTWDTMRRPVAQDRMARPTCCEPQAGPTNSIPGWAPVHRSRPGLGARPAATTQPLTCRF